MSSTCAECGRPAVFSVDQDGVSQWACAACTDRRVLMAGLSRIAMAFERGVVRTGLCPYCGLTAEHARETAMAGCPLCYEALGDVWQELGAPAGSMVASV